MDYCDSPEFYSETYPKARKVHRCCECGGPIRVGELYARCCGKYDGSMFCETQHIACRDFAAAVNSKHGGDDGCFIAFGDVHNQITNASEWCFDDAEIARLQVEWATVRAAGLGEAVNQ